ncbi:MAG: precorrin-8X methylmutase [Thermodesulfovibrionales bacterium]|nr:precorrin-8X methylmutase [Thermodesulfovibrionales bacterium]
MENIILIGHGSPKKDANNIEIVGRLLHNALHPCCDKDCVKVSYLQFAKPELPDAIKDCADKGAKRIIIHPYFLSSGMHVTHDIPEMIREAKAAYPAIEFVYTEPLGIHNKLVNVVIERIKAAQGFKPMEIEDRSFEILTNEADLSAVPAEQLPVVQRVIHATADFEFKNTLIFHPDAVRTGLDAIRDGKDILTDVEMVKTGIIKRWLEPFGGKVICNISDEDVIRASEATGKTRAEIAMEKALSGDHNIGIIAIGNAPTALLKVIEIFNSKPEISNLKSQILVVGVPVGFVKAFESKTLLAKQDFPFITNLSRKGGTPTAVAIVNALLKTAG